MISRYNGAMTQDKIDKILTQWERESPQLDLSSLAVIGRILQLSRLLEKQRESVLADFDLTL